MKRSCRLRAFTLSEILTVLAIVALLIALIVPVTFAVKKQAAQKTCLSNIRQVGLAVIQYTQDYDGTFPPVSQATLNASGISHEKNVADWHDLLKPYTNSADLKCPDLETPRHFVKGVSYNGYALNLDLTEDLFLTGGNRANGGQAETSVVLTSLTVSILETRAGLIGTNYADIDDAAKYKGFTKGAVRHNGGANYAFVDGHAKWHRPTEFKQVCDGAKPCFSQK